MAAVVEYYRRRHRFESFSLRQSNGGGGGGGDGELFQQQQNMLVTSMLRTSATKRWWTTLFPDESFCSPRAYLLDSSPMARKKDEEMCWAIETQPWNIQTLFELNKTPSKKQGKKGTPPEKILPSSLSYINTCLELLTAGCLFEEKKHDTVSLMGRSASLALLSAAENKKSENSVDTSTVTLQTEYRLIGDLMRVALQMKSLLDLYFFNPPPPG